MCRKKLAVTCLGLISSLISLAIVAEDDLCPDQQAPCAHIPLPGYIIDQARSDPPDWTKMNMWWGGTGYSCPADPAGSPELYQYTFVKNTITTCGNIAGSCLTWTLVAGPNPNSNSPSYGLQGCTSRLNQGLSIYTYGTDGNQAAYVYYIYNNNRNTMFEWTATAPSKLINCTPSADSAVIACNVKP